MIASYLLNCGSFVTVIIFWEGDIFNGLLVFFAGSSAKPVCNKRYRQPDGIHQYHHVFCNALAVRYL
jgi:hypothetical protein